MNVDNGTGALNDRNKDMHVAAPRWQFVWNLNTIVILLGFAAGIAAWGSTWERVNSGQRANSADIDRLESRVGAVEAATRRLDNHELRLTGVEQRATEAAAAMRAVEQSLNNLASDIRVTREIVQRMEAAQNGRAPPRN